MGQYHYIVNLDKREFINPHKLGVGLKACEQLTSPAGTAQALFVLLLCSNGRGGGDLAETRGFDERIIGRWAGDLMGLDHPLVQEELGRWRGLAPESSARRHEGMETKLRCCRCGWSKCRPETARGGLPFSLLP